MKQKLAIWGLAALFCQSANWAQAAPEPAKAPQSWQLDFTFHDLQRIHIVLPGDSQPTMFWFLLYTVTNNTGQDVGFYPTFELVTDSLQVVRGGDNISPSVYDAIRSRYKKIYPFFRDPSWVSGKLLQGPDNARTSAAVFRNFDPQSNAIAIFVSGLSGEIDRLANPTFDPSQPTSADNMQSFLLRKTLTIEYTVPGDVQTRQTASPVRRKREWVMR